MKKKVLFYSFSIFVLVFTLVAWQYAKVELTDMRSPQVVTTKDATSLKY